MHFRHKDLLKSRNPFSSTLLQLSANAVLDSITALLKMNRVVSYIMLCGTVNNLRRFEEVQPLQYASFSTYQQHTPFVTQTFIQRNHTSQRGYSPTIA